MRFSWAIVAMGTLAFSCSSFSGEDATPGNTSTDDGGGDAGADGPGVVTGTPQDFSLALAPVDDVTITHGTPTTVPITLSMRGKQLAGPITIKVTGLPSAITAAPLTLDGTTGNLVLSGPTAAQGPAAGTIEATIDTYKATTPINVFVRGAPGALDTTWGTNGQVLAVNEADNRKGTADLLLGQADDVYSVSGVINLTTNNADNTGHVAHLDKKGGLDPTYGSNGLATFNEWGPTAAALGGDGRVVVVGSMLVSTTGPGAIGRSTNALQLPPKGGAAEWNIQTTTPPGGLGVIAGGAYAVGIRADGHVFFGFDALNTGTTELDCGMTHLDPAGAPAPAFGSNGSERNTVSEPVAMALQSGGDLVVLSVGTDVVDYVRYNSDTGAAIDANPKTVTIAGVHRVASVGGGGLVSLADGSIVAPFNGTAGIYLVKLDVNGDPVAGFGTAGVAGPFTVGGSALASGVAVDATGRVLVALHTGGLIRVTPAGDLDMTFGTGGLAPTDTSSRALRRRVVVQKTSGRILASGEGTARGQVLISAFWP